MREKIPNNFVLIETVKLSLTLYFLAHVDGQEEDYAQFAQALLEQVVLLINNLKG